MKKILIEILQELKSINKKLQAIESSQEQKEIQLVIDEKKLAKIIHNPKSIIGS